MSTAPLFSPLNSSGFKSPFPKRRPRRRRCYGDAATESRWAQVEPEGGDTRRWGRRRVEKRRTNGRAEWAWSAKGRSRLPAKLGGAWLGAVLRAGPTGAKRNAMRFAFRYKGGFWSASASLQMGMQIRRRSVHWATCVPSAQKEVPLSAMGILLGKGLSKIIA